jgi:deoxynucleoside triphosphate triphosphohydrolase SAMHD1
MARDNYHLGDKDNVSFNRLIHSARVIDNAICYAFKDVNMLQNLCYTRFNLHKSYYSHKTARAIEFMIVDGLVAAEKKLKIAEQIFKPQRYLHLTDAVMENILASQDLVRAS